MISFSLSESFDGASENDVVNEKESVSCFEIKLKHFASYQLKVPLRNVQRGM